MKRRLMPVELVSRPIVLFLRAFKLRTVGHGPRSYCAPAPKQQSYRASNASVAFVDAEENNSNYESARHEAALSALMGTLRASVMVILFKFAASDFGAGKSILLETASGSNKPGFERSEGTALTSNSLV
jgi:hypothetical protein